MRERDIALQAALDAAEAIRTGFGRPAQQTEKGHLDFATDTDLEAERRIVALLSRHFPDYGILAEEGGWIASGSGSPFTWLIDPLCGTLNFAAGIPLFNVNIALLERGRPVLGVLAEPLAGDVLWAEQGSGAHLLAADGRTAPAQASGGTRLLALDFGHYPTEGDASALLDLVQRATLTPRFRLRMFSTSLGLGYVARGRLAAYAIDNARPWDVVAGAFICQQAGCVVTDLAGDPWQPEAPGLVAAADPETYDTLREHLASRPA
ncbi:MAG: inositol monophosphatase [Chloroflexi bacterium]|nr:inositol monophosphatase [Chloroflexota bacterium]